MPDKNVIHDGPVPLGGQPTQATPNTVEESKALQAAHYQKGLDAVSAAIGHIKNLRADLDAVDKEIADMHEFDFIPGVRSTVAVIRGEADFWQRHLLRMVEVYNDSKRV